MKLAAQAVQAQFDGAQSYPFAPAQNARAAGIDAGVGRDREADRAAKIDAVGAIVQVDQTARAWLAPIRARAASATASALSG